MFFSNSSKNGHDPFFFPDQTFFKQQDFHLPISFFPFPSPFEVDDDLLLQSHQLMTTNSGNATATAETATMVNSEQKKTPRKRLSKKDRHSKISTARGLRDRRMRLSLPVARQFFGLQDMLGVDKGSKTVEWLLVQARPEIIKLAKERNYNLDRAKSVSSSNSECDMVSGIDEVGAGDENDIKLKKMHSGKEKKRIRQPRKTMAKESREKARARARARTMEKMQIRYSAPFDHDENYTNFQGLSKITSWSSPFETGEESAGTQSYNVNPAMEVPPPPPPPPPQQLAEVEKPISSQFGTSEGMIDYQNSLEIMGKWSPSAPTFNYLHQTETLLQEQHQFADSQLFG